MADQQNNIKSLESHVSVGRSFPPHSETTVDRIYMDYNATTPLAPEVIQAVTEALQKAWGNPSSNHVAGVEAKDVIDRSRENVARMVGGKAEDVIFTSGGTEANNLVFHTAAEHYRRSHEAAEQTGGRMRRRRPHIIISNVEHDSVELTARHLERGGRADVTRVPVSKATGRVEAEDVVAAVRPSTCLVSVMLANNETGVCMPVRDICRRIKALNGRRRRLRILLHTDAAQALGKIPVDARELEVDYLTIAGHKFYGPRVGALYVNGPGSKTPVYPMLFGGGQEWNLRPGTENTPMIAGLGKAAELVTANLSRYESQMRSVRLYLEERLRAVLGEDRVRFNNGHFPGSDTLPNTCNVSILGPRLHGRKVLSRCTRLLASVGAACHSHADGDTRPSHVLLSCGVPPDVAANALRLSVGRDTTRADVDVVVEDLRDTVQLLEQTH